MQKHPFWLALTGNETYWFGKYCDRLFDYNKGRYNYDTNMAVHLGVHQRHPIIRPISIDNVGKKSELLCSDLLDMVGAEHEFRKKEEGSK